MKYLVISAALALSLSSLAVAAPPAGFASPGNGCDSRDPRSAYTDCNAARRAAEQKAKFDAEQRKRQEEARIRQQQIDAENARRAAENQRQIAAYQQRQMDQQRQQQNQLIQQQNQQQQAQQQRINDEIRSSGAVRVNSYSDEAHNARFTAFNNTSVMLNVKVSYDLRGEDGAYQRGETSCIAPPKSSCDWVYDMGPVSPNKRWTVNNTNITWTRWN